MPFAWLGLACPSHDFPCKVDRESWTKEKNKRKKAAHWPIKEDVSKVPVYHPRKIWDSLLITSYLSV